MGPLYAQLPHGAAPAGAARIRAWELTAIRDAKSAPGQKRTWATRLRVVL